MPDEYDDDLDEAQEGDSSVIRALRAELKKAKADATEAATLRTENALLNAGLKLTPAQTKAFLASHEGEMDKDSIRKTATEVLNMTFDDEAPAPEPKVPAEEQAAHQRAQEAANGAEAAEAHPETINDRIAKAQSPQELDRILADAGVSVNAEI